MTRARPSHVSPALPSRRLAAWLSAACALTPLSPVVGAVPTAPRSADGVAAPSLASSSSTSSTSSAPSTTPPARLRREAPAGFSPSSELIDRALTWRGERLGAIVFVARPDDAKAYALVPASTRAFRAFLLGLGFERQAVEAYLRQPTHVLGAATCLALEAAPQTCIEVHLSLDPATAGQPAGDLRFVAQDAQRQLLPQRLAEQAPALIGSSSLSLGTSRSSGLAAGASSSTSSNLNLALRGIASQGDGRIEYDVASSTLRTDGSRSSSLAWAGGGATLPQTVNRINLLAAGQRLGVDGGTAYAGVFQSDTGLTSAGGGAANMFFVRPTLLGLAWRSDGGRMSAYGRTQRVRLVLLAPSYVRVLSQGSQVYEGQLPPGEQVVSFPGYGEPFVDVVVRDASGVEQRLRTAVLPSAPEDAPAFDATQSPHGFYADVGRPLLQNYTESVLQNGATVSRYQRMRLQDQAVASFGYVYSAAWGSVRSGVQAGSGFTRWASSVADRGLTRQASLMLGTQGERGASLSWQPLLASVWQPSASATYYRTSEAARLLSAGYASPYLTAVPSVPGLPAGRSLSAATFNDLSCSLVVNALNCYSPTNYRAWSLGLARREFPVSVNLTESRSDQYVSRRATVQGSYAFDLAGRRSTLLALLSYEPTTRNKALLLSLVVPLDNPGTLVTTSASSDFHGNTSASAGYSQSFAAADHEHLRSVSLSASGAQSASGTNDASAIGYATSQFGPVGNTLSVSGSRYSTSVQTTFSMDHALTGQGAAFTRDRTSGVSTAGLFNSEGSAGVAVFNHSQEAQTALIGGGSFEVPAGANVFVPISSGYLRGVTVSPGPALREEKAKAGEFLYKGNVKSVVIGDGFWVLARFEQADGAALPVQFTYKLAGEKLERLYLDSKGRALLFELREPGPALVRYVVTEAADGRPAAEFRCEVPQSAVAQPDAAAGYQTLNYACRPLPAQDAGGSLARARAAEARASTGGN